MASFWKEEIASAGNSARRVWNTVDNILGEAEFGPIFSPDDFNDFIDKKVGDVRASTASVGRPSFTDRQAPNCLLSS